MVTHYVGVSVIEGGGGGRGIAWGGVKWSGVDWGGWGSVG